MPLQFASSTPAQQQSIAAFLVATFREKPDAPFVDPLHLHWKFHEPRPDWNGSRSYVLSNGERIAAHGCACPVTFLTATGKVTSNHPIDWAAARSFPGAGVALLDKLGSMTDTLLAVGGSADTLQVLPKLGYRQACQRDVYVRVVRPWSQMRTDPYPRGWKQPLRLLRNLAWKVIAAPASFSGWSFAPAASFGDDILPLLPRSGDLPFTPAARSPQLLNYMLRCPGAAMSGYLIHERDTLRGWFLLSRVGGQGRIADLWIDSLALGDWIAAYALATQAAAADPQTFELVAAASVPMICRAIRAAGYRRYSGEPVFLRDPDSLLNQAPPLSVALMEGDAAYLSDPSYPYLG